MKKNRNELRNGRTFWRLSVLGLVALGLFSSAWAQRAVSIDPPVELYTAQPGETIDATFNVTNPGETPARVRLYLSDWMYQSDGTPNYLPVGEVPGSASEWITFTPSQLDLAPGETAEVRYTAEVPAEAGPGTHWSVLFLEGEDPNPQPGFRLAAFNVRVGHTIYVNVPPIVREGVIGGIFGERIASPVDAFRLYIQYLNSGNAAQIVSGYIEVRDATGATVIESDFPDWVVLPNSDRVFSFDALGPLPAGTYSALVVMNYGDESIDVAGDFAFSLQDALPEAPPISSETGDPNDGEGSSTTP